MCHNVAVMVIIFILTSGDNSFSLLFLFLMFSMNHRNCVGFLSGAGKLMLKESLTHLHPGTFHVVTKKDGASMSIADTWVRNTM